jgi:alkylation response protein AidB-like acyl-CoA dehydrogenase
MDFEQPAERRMLVETIDRYLADRYPFAERDRIAGSDLGQSPEHWSALAELGVVGALFPEESGGFAGSGHDIAAVFEALGRGLVVEPFLGALMAGLVLAETGRTELLAKVIAGETQVAFASENVDIAVRPNGTASGIAPVVPQIAAADHVIVAAGNSLLLVARDAPGVSVRDYLLIDGGRGGDLLLDNASAELLSDDAAPLLEKARAAGVLALCAEAVGIMDRLRDQTLDYLRTRQQFGVPIGSFQVLKHRMANVALEIEQARSAVTNAAEACDGERLTRERAMSAAKFTIGRTGTLVAEEAIQMHGGIGMTWELPLSHYAKRLIMIGHQLGDEDHHLDRYMELALKKG